MEFISSKSDLHKTQMKVIFDNLAKVAAKE